MLEVRGTSNQLLLKGRALNTSLMASHKEKYFWTTLNHVSPNGEELVVVTKIRLGKGIVPLVCCIGH